MTASVTDRRSLVTGRLSLVARGPRLVLEKSLARGGEQFWCARVAPTKGGFQG
jgi:hypothetical protein